ncbi:E3 ubiquitin-protein ligase bre1 [Tilletia horrida]|uniref:E3 ubiquitin protein ligase n=1 Tax=Tilletia horrida TaxID=155126 RepID=A0AAN6GU65_9BASI|nr:E3 ubiquitin-protein ligase bre1 [Tilletia horrida]KAK0554295.1 E3 ubiquitin-protein ligase bre1 [Tilletia horrida]KAK0563386.1 E3 ubiquitin-protein ligase bre1 [Tilletia horrida]
MSSLTSPVPGDEHRKRRHPDHPDDSDDLDPDRKRPYQPSSSSSSLAAAVVKRELPYDSVRSAGRAGFKLEESDKEPPRGASQSRGRGDADRMDEDEEEEEDKTVVEARLRLDAYRKDAIYRHFLQSKRELERIRDRLSDKEEQLQEAQERIQAFDIFWDTLVEDVRLLFKDDAVLEAQDRKAFLDAIPFTTSPLSQKAFSQTIEARKASLRAVLSRIAAQAAASDAPEVDTLRARCHESASEAAYLKTSLAQAQATADSLEKELSETREALSRAELRADRSQSAAVRSAEMSGQDRAAEEKARAEREALLADVEKLKAERETQRSMPNGADSKGSNGAGATPAEEGSQEEKEAKARAELAERLNEAQKISAKRLDELSKLRSQLADAEGQVYRLRRDVDYPPDSLVRRGELFKSADREVDRQARQVEHINNKYVRARQENEELREKMSRFKEEIQKELQAETVKLRTVVASRDADLARLRKSRDELLAELSERKARDKDKFQSAEDTRRLLAAKEVILGVISNENRAWRLKDAARRGDQAALDQLIQQGPSSGSANEPPTSVEDQLFARLKAAEALAEERQAQIEARALAATEAELASKLAQSQKDLDQLKALLGQVEASDAEAVRARLAEQAEKLAELDRKIVTETTRADAACDDLDKMSQAYDEIAKLAEDKVKHLATLEDRVIRLNTEKSKADNKYFSAMRSKEALEADKKVSARNAERQTAVIQQLAETEKTHTAHVAAMEAELSNVIRARDDLEKRVVELEAKSTKITSESVQVRDQSEKTQQELLKTKKDFHEARDQCFKAEEKVTELSKTTDKMRAERDSAVAAKDKILKRRTVDGAGGGTSNAEAEHLRALLRCSSCKDNFRERIITKCMHTFCSQCIDARIQTRQRKCPHCGIAFAQSDVQILYLQ